MNMSNTRTQTLWLPGLTSGTGKFSKYSILLKFSVIAILLIGLSGCFKSSKELISADNADYPFTTITYVGNEGGDKITLVRVGDRYLVTKEGERDYLRFKAFGENTYVVQVTVVDEKEPTNLYGLVKVSPDRKSFEIIKAVAQAADLAAARKGKPGLEVCDEDTVCIATLEDYVKYAREAPPPDRKSRFQILALE